ncbi:sensor domain-containing diguanylate cyclase [Halonatronum saccharophilum]|uniref:sensor domain-containing diguanylate cyclase n=1 Tax=Halonatronum saccharophilum TaxID=150060 RepID=UPI0004830799|nr:diguanylate cyclase [Halonatronum saccharophilum]
MLNVFYLLLIVIPILVILFYSLFNLDQHQSKLIRSIALLLILLIYKSFFGDLSIFTIYSYMVISILVGGIKGGIVSLLFSLLFVFLYQWNFIHIVYFVVILLIGGDIYYKVESGLKKNIALNLNLAGQIKELRVLRETSAILQGTLELNKVLQIIISSITAGYGLGFNRAILFLVDEGKIKGELGIGPLTRQEGLQTWQNVAANKINLEDMISIQEELELSDKRLNDIVKEISIDLGNNNIATKVIEEMIPYNISTINPDDKFQVQLAAKLNMGSFALVPLIVKGKTIGLISVDNIANQRKITYKKIDSLMPFANQAALAIENARLHKLKEDMAIKDNLTGLYNQRYFQISLEEKIEESKNLEKPMALLMIDIDYFKVYNDNNGHPLGNESLVKLAKILDDSVRDDDIVCRFGGEEFAIILPNVSEELALVIAQRVRERVFKTEFKKEQTQPNGSVTISTGIGIFPEDAKTDRELLNVADEALYYAKNSGRNNVKTYKEYLSGRREG